MDGQELQKIAGDCAVGLPGTDLEHRLGVELAPLQGSRQSLHAHDQHAGALVIDSYRLVVSGLPKSEQPVDPRTYGRRA